MKSSLFLLPSCLLLASASPLFLAKPTPQVNLSNGTNEMLHVIAEKRPCSEVAVIFARGAFDSENIGVWVRSQFFNRLKARIPHAAFQNFDPEAYPTTLADSLGKRRIYDLTESIQMTIDAYVATCPGAAIVVSSWSKGGLVIRNALAKVSPAAGKQIAAVVTFNERGNRLLNTPISNGGEIPILVQEINTSFQKVLKLTSGREQRMAAKMQDREFTAQLKGSLAAVIEPLAPSQFMRLVLNPGHSFYGNNGVAKEAAELVTCLHSVKNAKLIPPTPAQIVHSSLK